MHKKNIIYMSIAILSTILLVLVGRYLIDKFEETKIISELHPIDNLNNLNIEVKQEEIFNSSSIGSLTIPKINLYNIEICEGVELETLSKTIGHFENTNIYDGNVGLASHNAGTNANYFSDIHKLKSGDEIYYKTRYGIKKYKVHLITEIDSYDWSYLEETKDNRITLITCISGSQDTRLCVQGIEEYNH